MHERQALVNDLLALSDAELVCVLQQVFGQRQPNPEEDIYNRNHYFLGTASQVLDSDMDEPDAWGEWEIEAVGYQNPDTYPAAFDPDYGLCQRGACRTCGVQVRSYVKNAICPVCQTPVLLG